MAWRKKKKKVEEPEEEEVEEEVEEDEEEPETEKRVKVFKDKLKDKPDKELNIPVRQEVDFERIQLENYRMLSELTPMMKKLYEVLTSED